MSHALQRPITHRFKSRSSLSQPCQRHSLHVKHTSSIPELTPHARSSQTPTTPTFHLLCPSALKTHVHVPLFSRPHSSSSLSSLPLPPLPLHSAHTQTPPHALPHLPLKLPSPLPPHLRRLNIRRTLIIRLCQHTHHRNQYLLHALYRTPSFARFFVVVRIVAGSVEDGDADEAVGVDCVSER